MLKLIATLVGVLALSAGAWGLLTANAQAADGGNGKNVYTIQADCGDGPVDIRVNLAAGEWSAVHPVDGGTFVPIAFGEQHGAFTDPEGNSFPIDEDGGAKGQSAHGANETVNCSFDIDVEFPDGSTLQLEGTVTGFYPGAN